MRRLLVATTFILISNYESLAFAGKVDDVQAAVKKACAKELSDEEALRMVKSLFLSCVSGAKIQINGCAVGCLKQNSGAIIGQ